LRPFSEVKGDDKRSELLQKEKQTMKAKRAIVGFATSDTGDGVVEVRLHFNMNKRTFVVWGRAGMMLLIVLLVASNMPGAAELVRYLVQVK
jgi:hypothetical protein